MKVLPQTKVKQRTPEDDLPRVQRMARLVALWVAFGSVFVFFFKLLFF
ncbi:hypothetical protein [Siphonobacter aquaeclarae]|jgi:hypothetical protein|uniref:Uncharacterized protein n=1 Tax=Siphonobacter aquaeclarae TaxID=563176 RepID=A0A1G9WTL1_9BACT|nr:hypothetical protein [Siphonobacter aquaeclarae]MBO9637602.1 hypothetical protein [Siphonobacter aquaeclarae]SDM87473.1 hypothetical protein SAMN04488090_4420 [Siphonobacter aquaeclarae]